MDIDRVRYFCVFASVGSFTQASEILKISQPALSKSLKVLEGETGLTLVEREGRGLILTKHGELFFRQAEPLLHSWLDLGRNLQRSTKEKTFRIGSFEVFTTYFLGELLSSSSLSSMEAFEFRPGRMEEAVRDRIVDVGITYVPIPKERVVFKEATQITSGVFGTKERRGAKHQKPFVIPIAPLEGTPSKVVGLDGWPDHEYPRESAFRVTLMQTALEICSQGLAVAYLPEFVVKLYNARVKEKFHLVEQACPIPAKQRKQSVYLVQRQGDEESSDVRAIAKALRALRG